MQNVAATSKGLSQVHPSIQKLADSVQNPGDDASLVKSIKSLQTLAKNEKNRQQIFLTRTPSKLIELCKSENPTVVENAARCLMALAEGDEHINLIGSQGMDIFLTNAKAVHSDVAITSCKLLAQMALTAENRELIRTRGGLSSLANCLQREHEWIRLYATKALMAASVDDSAALQQELRNHNVERVYEHYRAHVASS